MPDYEKLRQAAARKLNWQAARAVTFQTYYDNEAGIIALMDTDERRTFKSFLAECSTDWCALVVNAVAERLAVVGFRFGDQAASDAAWAIWQANSMDADHRLVHADALTMSSSFVMVQPDDDNPTGVCISPESPLQATVLYEPGNRRKRLAGFKRYSMDAEADMYALSGASELAAGGGAVEVLILPDEIVTWWPGDPAPQIERNAAGAVGMVEIVPQPRSLGPPRSEMTPAMRIQDRINTTCFSRLVATDFGAYRTIWATGVKIAQQVIKGTDGDVTRVVPPFQLGANRLLTNEDPAGKFGSVPESALTGYLASVEQDVQHLAATTQTPTYYLVGHMVNLAADAIKAADVGLVSKVEMRARYIGEGWEEVARLALALVGNAAATNLAAEVVWADFETRSEGQRVDALVKMGTLGVPQQVLWEKWGASTQEIARWLTMPGRAPYPAPAPAPAPGPPAPAPEPTPAPAEG